MVLTVGKDFTYNEETDKYVLTIENVLPGGYTVEETTVQPDGTVMTVTYKVGDGEETEGAEAQAEVAKGQKTAVEFSDEFEVTTGILELTKTIEGDLTLAEIDGDLTFVVSTEVEEGGETVTKYLGKDGSLSDEEVPLTVGSDFTLNEETGKYVLTIKNVTPGGYTVKETTVQPDGTVMTVTYKVGDGEEQTGSEAEAEVTKNQKTTVEFSDEIREVGSLELTKTIEGDLTLAEIEGDLTFVVSTEVEEGGETVTKYLAKDGSLSDEAVPLTVGSDFTLNEETGKYVLTIKNVTPGGYTVKER